MFKKELYYCKDYLGLSQPFGINRINEQLKHHYIYHYHEFLEICYVSSGTGYHIVDGKKYNVHKGDIFVINNNICHGFYRESPCKQLITYNIIFTLDFIDDNLKNFRDINVLHLSNLFKDVWDVNIDKANINLCVAEQKEFNTIINNMYMEYSMKKKGYTNLIRVFLLELILKILRNINSGNSSNYNFNKCPVMIESCVNYLQDNYNKRFSLNDLSQKSHFSKNYFCKLFKMHTGMSVYEFIQNLRIENACKALKTTDKKVVDIAMDVGFSDYKSFNVTFKRLTGMKPLEYKKIG